MQFSMKAGFCAIAGSMLAAMPLSLPAQGQTLLGKQLENLDADDLNRMHAAAARLYEGRSIGTVERWRNPDSKNAGTVKLLWSFQAQGMPCAHMQYTIRFDRTRDAVHPYVVNWCKTGSGDWKMLEAKPPAS